MVAITPRKEKIEKITMVVKEAKKTEKKEDGNNNR